MKQRRKEEFNKHNNKHNKKHKHILLILLTVLLNLLNINIEKKDNKKNKLRKMQPRPRKELKHQKNQNIILSIKMSERQIIEQSQNREQELHQRKALVNYYRRFPPENQHLEVKINQNMIILNRNTSLKENQVGHQILNHPITE